MQHDEILAIAQKLIAALRCIPFESSRNIFSEVQQRLRTVAIEHEEICRLRHSLETKTNELINRNLLDRSAGQDIAASQICQVPSERAAETISMLSARLDHAISLTTQCDDLKERLDLSGAPVVDRPLTNLDHLIDALERSRDELDAELRARADRAKIFDDLLHNIRSLGPENATRFIDEIDPGQWISLLDAMQDMPSVGPAEGREARRAAPDVIIPMREVAPLIFNRIAGRSIHRVPDALSSIHRLLPVIDECAADFLCLQHIAKPLLCEIAREIPEAASQVVAVLLLDAIADGDPANWQWIEAAAHINTVRVEIANLALAVCQHELDHPGTALAALAPPHDFEKPVDAAPSYQQRLLDVISHVGMSKNYHKLREAVREKCLAALKPHIETGNAAAALAVWNASGGSVDAIIDTAIGPRDSWHNLENKHISNTTRWLENVERDLRSWAALTRQKRQHADPQLSAAIQDLRKLASENQRGLSALTVKGIDTLIASSDPNAEDTLRVRVGPDSTIHTRFLQPPHVAAWIDAVTNAAGARPSAILADLFLCAADPEHEIKTYESLFQQFLDRNRYDVATAIAEQHPHLRAALQTEISNQWETSIEPFTEILNKAELLRHKDEDVALCLDVIESAKSSFDFADARDTLDALTLAVESFETTRQSEHVRLSTLLQEAGLLADGEVCSVQEMRSTADKLLKSRATSRQHILLMYERAHAGTVPAPIADCLQSVLASIDRPTKWPHEDEAAELREATSAILDFWERKYSYLTSKRPTQVGDLNSLFAFWMTTQFSLLGTDGQKEAITEITTLALSIVADELEIDEVFAHMRSVCGSVDASQPTFEPLSPSVATTKQHEETIPVSWTQSRRTAAPEKIESILRDLRAFVKSTATELEAQPADISEKVLRVALRDGEWNTVTAVAQALVSAAVDALQLGPIEAVAAVAAGHVFRARRSRPASDAFIYASVGAAWALVENRRIDSYAYIRQADFESNLMLFFLCGVSSEPVPEKQTELRTLLCSTLEALRSMPMSQPAAQFVFRLLMTLRATVCPERQRSGADILAGLLWDACTGAKSVAEPRAALVLLLYRLGYIDDVVAFLAKQYAPSLEGHIVQFMKAAKAAEANPEAWDEARRIAQSFFEQAPDARMKPWRIAIDHLNLTRKDSTDATPCALSLEGYALAGETLVLDVVVRPSAYSYPENLRITVNILDISTIEPKTITFCSGECISRAYGQELRIPLGATAPSRDSLSVSFLTIGQSTAGDPIDIRGRWDLNLRAARAKPFSDIELNACWPGATGDPVESITSYHGRKRERDILTSLLAGHAGRQKSAVITGQRRIGKTSLLKDLIRACTPDGVHMTGVFVNLGGIQEQRDEGLAQAFFSRLTRSVEGDAAGHNRPVSDLLEKQLGSSWNRELRRHLDARESIETALTRYVDRMISASGGKISRIAFFIDEFQSVFEFPSSDIDALLWSLRPIVQTSPNISLVMAGSGLTRDLVDRNDQAFFGSVREIRLGGFSLQEDRDAIRKTVFPDAVEDRLCPDVNQRDSLVETAFRLTQGHPWYLSMLGYSAARLLEGRVVTPALLHQVAEQMVRGDTATSDVAIGARKFYDSIFDALDALPQKKACAQLVLASIARQVSIEWSKLSIDRAIHSFALDKSGVSDSDRLDALRLLENDGVVVRDRGTRGRPVCRIVTPLVAEAVRYDADAIEEDALVALSRLSGGAA